MIKTEIKEYLDYGKVLSLSNGVIEALVTVDVGPRIIRFGFVDGQNIMCDNRSVMAPKEDREFCDFFGEGKKWEILGGHRIWTSPESYPHSYYPDLDTVKYEITEHGAVFTPNPEKENGRQKQLEIKMDPDDANMYVTMRVTNIADKPQKFAIWGLTVSATDGTLIMPMNSNDTGLLHNRNISVWPYTNLADPRVYFGKNYVTLHQDKNNAQSFKLGFGLNNAEAYYCLGEDVFRKSYDTNHETEVYPDNDCSFETFTNNGFIEVESLSPLKLVSPNETVELTEHWSMHKKPCDVDFKNDDSIEKMLNKL